MRHRVHRIGSILACIAVAGTSPGLPVAAQDASPAPVAEVQPTLTDSIDRSIAAHAAAIDGDPAAALALVAERIELETYAGSMKGPRGAWITGAANDVDQARLLAALIAGEDGVPAVRYASCPAPSDPIADVAAAAKPVLALDLADAIAAAVTDPELKAAILELRDLRTATQAAAQRSADALAVELARAPAPAGGASATAGPAQHVWLQVEGPEGWMDVDATTSTGAAPCAAATTADVLPPDDAHRVSIRLVVEQRTAAGMTEWTALESRAETADLAASRITFGFTAAEGPGLVAWTPELRIDNVSFLGTPILLPPVPPPPDAEGGGLGLDPFGIDGTTPEPSSSPAPEPEPVTAAWLVIELTAPSGTTTLRSDVFDRIGVVARGEGTAATAPVLGLDEMEGGSAALGARWQIGLLLGDLRIGEELVDADLDLATTDGMAGRIDALLRLFPSIRRDLGGSPATGPMVVLAGLMDVTGPAKRGGLEPGQVITQLVFDALHVPVAAPRDAIEAARDAAAIVAGEGMLIAIAGFTPHPFGSADAVFAAAATAGTPLVLLSPGAPAAIAGASPVALARMSAPLTAGSSILTPAVPPSMYGTARTAWYVIDPETGIVRDEHETGRHQGMSEDVTNRSSGPSGFQRFCAFAERISRPVALAAMLAITLSPGSMGKGAEAAAREFGKIVMNNEVQRRKRELARMVSCAVKTPGL